MSRRRVLQTTAGALGTAAVGTSAVNTGSAASAEPVTTTVDGSVDEGQQQKHTYTTKTDTPSELTVTLDVAGENPDSKLALFVDPGGHPQTVTRYEGSAYYTDPYPKSVTIDLEGRSRASILVASYGPGDDYTLAVEETPADSTAPSETITTTMEGSVEVGEDGKHTYTAEYDNPYRLTATLDVPEQSADSDLALHVEPGDWHPPRVGSYDKYTSHSSDYPKSLSITIDEHSKASFLVLADEVGGDYTLTIEETPLPNNAPEAALYIADETVDVTEPARFSAYAAEDPDGSIDRYEWDFGDGTTDTGIETQHAYEDPGEYTVTLTCIDEDGASSSATGTVDVSAGYVDGPCETLTERQESGQLDAEGDTDTYTVDLESDNPCALDFDMDVDNVTGSGSELFGIFGIGGENPYIVNFDLYVTFDGRTPTEDDHDVWRTGTEPALALDSDVLAPGQTVAVSVKLDKDEGHSGEYSLTITEKKPN
jgi:PKD repeat protein